jgi:hypothetical protein
VNALPEIGRNPGALPRLRGHGEQRDIVTHALNLSTLYVALITDLGRHLLLLPGRDQSKSQGGRARHAQGHYQQRSPVHRGLPSEAALQIPQRILILYEKLQLLF